ncbi:MAG: NAD-dependent epimerase/dehydratase family protein [Crenarchaeota archaeon]|nr:MAG: NAD-dependent epimerase/dehydratase family protein [Thermoproteota archaeon]RDJ33332.1 MAG: NAD-dependent epimerase/dehydratase family protein [Thermoproteota archaeon]RDJ36165.1 MAG: NAD-dependent epimerase/dehydratase family protein [Thermoproteota archaeon]RDJ38796.1 MAG: NAD-dependent epimerase/dehydratase family protein [Thermoproteota archaeon]
MKSSDFGKVVITGGAGFIGSHLAEKILHHDNEVTVIDNFATGSKDNLVNCLNNSKFSYLNQDLKNIDKINEIISDALSVFHLAAHPEVRTGFENPSLAYKENIENTYFLLENIRKSNVKKLIFASSSVVYGEPSIIPTKENYGPLLPISAYGGSKLACEGLISSYCNNYGIKAAIIRLANVIGSRSRHGVIWDFINKLKINKEILDVLGDGSQSKSYVHVSDCVDGFLTAIQKSNENVGIYNIGNIDKTDVMTIANIVCQKMNLGDVKIVPNGGTKDGRGWIGDVKEMQLDVSKIQELGWKAKFSSTESVELAVKELLSEICYTRDE